ncbi:MAG: TonB family protein [Zoogloeaceae bacterium]|nr:TonB family protein [Zoogloeaceae bacterium]
MAHDQNAPLLTPRWGLTRAFLFSIALHTLPWLAGWQAWHWWQAGMETKQREQLMVEVLGMVADRQMAKQEAGADVDWEAQTSTPPPAAQPRQRPAPKTPPHASVTPHPQQNQAIDADNDPTSALPPPSPPNEATPRNAEPLSAETAPTESQLPTPTPTADNAPSQSGMAEAREQLRLSQQEIEAHAIRRYLAGLKKALEARLTYPPEARRSAYTGNPVIRFVLTEDGHIEADSLRVQRSSGHALLDESALKAARTTPMEKPPRKMEVVIAVSFAREP